MRKIYLFMLLLFVTAATNAQVLLSESFEGTTFPPAGWTRVNAGTGNNWQRYTDYATFVNGAADGTAAMGVHFNPTSAQNTWMFTPGLTLTAGVSYTLSFSYVTFATLDGTGSVYAENLKVTVGNAATAAAATTVLMDSSLTNVDWRKGVFTYVPASTGTYYFGFNCHSAADKWRLSVDQVKVSVTPSGIPTCATPVSPLNGATNVTYDPALTLRWKATAGATEYDVYVGTSYIYSTADTFANLTGATALTTYSWHVVPKNSFGSATGCDANAQSFTTAAALPPPSCAVYVNPLPNATGVNPNSLAFRWRKDPNATSYYFRFADAADQLIYENVVTDTFIVLNLQNLPNDSAYNNTFKWKVLPLNAEYDDGPANCNLVAFSTMAKPTTAPTCTQLISPANGATNVQYVSASGTPAINISWNAVPNATGYKVYLGATASSLQLLGTAGGTSVNITGIATSSTNYWNIIPTNSIGDATGCPAPWSFTTAATVPVTLVDFTAEKKGTVNQLTWTTATEQNNAGFAIERSANGKDFTTLSFVNSKGDNGFSNATLNYSFVDETPLMGVNYYRLKQTDKDGRFEYSKTVKVANSSLMKFEIVNVYPNPAKDQVRLILNSVASDKVSVAITDLSGKLISNQAASVKTGDNEVVLNVSALSAGSYFITVTSGNGEKLNTKFIKQ